MAVYVYPADITGCGYYRLIWPAQALRARGYDVKVVLPKQRGNSLNAEMHGDTVVNVFWPSDATTIVLQRITHDHLVQAVKIMVERGLKIVVDMDDDLAAIDPNNPAWHAMHPQHGIDKHHNWINAQRACDVASMVTVSTDALLGRYARHGRGIVLRNCVPKRYLDIEHEDSNVPGWGGAIHVHPGDVQVMGSSVAQLTRDGSRFRIIGPGDGVAKALSCTDDIIEATGQCDLQTEWPESVTTLGIGVAPLADTRFNAGKSHLKILEYSALGVPWVASPRCEYRRAHSLYGVGMLADKPRQWLAKLRELRSSEALRREMSAAGREWASTMTIDGNADRWAEVWL